MQLKLYNFFKRKNSTRQPIVEAGTTDAKLKDPCSVIHPVFILERKNFAFNYIECQLYNMKRFYFINDITYDGNEMIVSCDEDFLATHKDAIKTYDGFIIRSSDSSFYNVDIIDNLNPATEDLTVQRVEGDILTGTIPPLTPLFHSSETDGTYVLTVVGKTQGVTTGFATSYALSQGEMLQLQNKFNDSGFLQQLKNEFTNPLDSVVSCKYVPIKRTDMDITSATEALYIGSQDTEVNTYRIKSKYIYGGIDIQLPTAYQGYKNAPPFSTYAVYLPFIGLLPLDYQVIEKDNRFLAFCHVDIITGDVIYKVVEYDANNYDKIMATFSGNCATDVPISSSQYSASSIASGILTTIGGVIGIGAAIATGGAALPAVGIAAGGIGLTIKGTEAHAHINGAISTALSSKITTKAHIIIVRKQTAHSITDIASVSGIPTYKMGMPMSHPGFLQYENASIGHNIQSGYSLLKDEIENINNFMNSGFYYE